MTAPTIENAPFLHDPGTIDAMRKGLPAGVPDELLIGAMWLSLAGLLGELKAMRLRRYSDQMPSILDPRLGTMGFQGWAAGVERAVFLHRSGWCLKVPTTHLAIRANEVELRLLQSVLPLDRTRFAETYELLGHLLLQRAYRIDPEHRGTPQETAEVLDIQGRYGIRDVHAHNIGWTEKGAWVLTDWAGEAKRRSNPDDVLSGQSLGDDGLRGRRIWIDGGRAS